MKFEYPQEVLIIELALVKLKRLYDSVIEKDLGSSEEQRTIRDNLVTVENMLERIRIVKGG